MSVIAHSMFIYGYIHYMGMPYKDTSTKTSIMVEKSTRDKLNRIGVRGETYDAIINRLLKNA